MAKSLAHPRPTVGEEYHSNFGYGPNRVTVIDVTDTTVRLKTVASGAVFDLQLSFFCGPTCGWRTKAAPGPRH